MDPLQQLQRFERARLALGQRLAQILEAELPKVAACLDAAAQQADIGRFELLSAATLLSMQSRGRALTAVHRFDEQVRHCLQQWSAASQAAAGAKMQLPRVIGLAAEQGVEQQLLAADLARATKAIAPAAQASLSGRIATLNELQPLASEQEDWQPLGAYSLSSAVASSISGLGMHPELSATLSQCILLQFPERLAQALELLERELQQEGIEPAAPVQEPEPALAPVDEALVVRASSSTSESSASTSDLALGQIERAAHALGREPLAMPSAPLVRTAPIVSALQSVAVREREAVAFAHERQVEPFSKAARIAWFEEARKALMQAQAQPAQLAMCDVANAMFDYAVDDGRIADRCRHLFWRLQHPVLGLSLLDSRFLSDADRSVRRLVETLSAICTAYVDELAHKETELFRRLETVVRAVEIVAAALQNRSVVLAHQADVELKRARQGMQQLVERVTQERASLEATPGRRNRRDLSRRPSKEREQQVSESLRKLLLDRLDGRDVPDSVRDFLDNVWMRHLRTAALRDGEDSPQFRVALEVVDDLLWTIDGQGKRQSRRELAQRIPVLLKLLTNGIRSSGVRDDEYRAFLDELFLMHLRKMQGKNAEPAAFDPQRVIMPEGLLGAAGGVAEAAPPSVPLLSPEMQVSTASRPEAIFDDLPSLRMPGETRPVPTKEITTAPANEPERKLLEVLSSLDLSDGDQERTVLELSAHDALALVDRGRWLELVSSEGQRSRAKVAWVNHRRTVVLLMRYPDRKAVSLRMQEVQSRIESGRLSILG
jgi:hypothetical protein